MSARKERAVLLTGFDRSARTALGDDWGTSWSALAAGCRHFESLRDFIPGWPDDAPVAILRDWWPSGFKLIGRAKTLSYALGQDMRLVAEELVRDNSDLRICVIIATSHGEHNASSEFAEHIIGPTGPLEPSVAEAMVCDSLLAAFLDGVGAAWPGQTVAAACASACVGTGLATARISQGVCDACFVVSLDVLSRVAHAGFRQIGAMSLRGCRPFDRRRDGTTIGEAGAVVLLATEGVVLPTSARWTVRVQGFGQSCDARHPVEPSAGGIGDALTRALEEAECRAIDLAAVYWHGTGTVQNDGAEAAAASKLFGDSVPAGTSTKGAFGHAMGASAALSILAAGETIKSRILPPVAGLEEPEYPDLNLVTDRAVMVADGPVAVVALGFGGLNAALVLNSV